MRKEVVRLEDHADARPDGVDIDTGIGDLGALQPNDAVIHVFEQVDAPQQGGLAGPGGADEHDTLTLGDGQIDLAQDHVRAKGLAQSLDLQDGGHRCPPAVE